MVQNQRQLYKCNEIAASGVVTCKSMQQSPLDFSQFSNFSSMHLNFEGFVYNLNIKKSIRRWIDCSSLLWTRKKFLYIIWRLMFFKLIIWIFVWYIWLIFPLKFFDFFSNLENKALDSSKYLSIWILGLRPTLIK